MTTKHELPADLDNYIAGLRIENINLKLAAKQADALLKRATEICTFNTQDEVVILDIEQFLASQQGEPIMCGGCGNSDPNKRCVNCFHDFGEHPEQAEGAQGERKRFEAEVLGLGLPVERDHHGAYVSDHVRHLWSGWELRAALAQPSPAPELERPEVQRWTLEKAHRFLYANDEVVEASEFDRIVGALRFERQQMDRAFTACINERDELRAGNEYLRDVMSDLRDERDAEKARADRFLRLLQEQKKITDKVASTSYADGVDDAEQGKVGGQWRTKLFDEATNRANDLGYVGVLDALDDLKKTTNRLHEVATACATAEQERDAAHARVAELETELAMTLDAAAKGDEARAILGGMELEAIAREMKPLPTEFAQAIEDNLPDLLIKGEQAPELERPVDYGFCDGVCDE